MMICVLPAGKQQSAETTLHGLQTMAVTTSAVREGSGWECLSVHPRVQIRIWTLTLASSRAQIGSSILYTKPNPDQVL